jgi:hypothetical protein
MKLDDANRWMSLIASVGVILGLILLAIELQQNQEMMRAQTRNEIALGVIDLMMVPASNPQLASVMRRGGAGEELSPDEYFQFRRMAIATLRYYENVRGTVRKAAVRPAKGSLEGVRGAFARDAGDLV